MWNGTMFVDLDWPLNASSPLSASAELLVDITSDFGWKSQIFLPSCIKRPRWRGSRWNFVKTMWLKKQLEWCLYQTVLKFWRCVHSSTRNTTLTRDTGTGRVEWLGLDVATRSQHWTRRRIDHSLGVYRPLLHCPTRFYLMMRDI